MVNELNNIQILFDLMNGLSKPKSEDEILNKIIPLFVRKLNCFMVSVLKYDDDVLHTKLMKPIVFQKNQIWQKVLNYVVINTDSNEEIDSLGSYEFIIEDKYFYKFVIEDYGYLILGKNKTFDKIFRYELSTVVAFLSKSLTIIVERKKLQDSERKILVERNLLKTIIDNVPFHVFAKDVELNRILSNKVELDYLGVAKEEEVYGKKDVDIYPFCKREWAEKDIRVLNGQSIINEEGLSGDGKEWFLSSKFPLTDFDNNITGLVGILINITDQKRLEQELKEALKEAKSASTAKEQFLANMSHEIRTPLNIITGMIRELQKGKINDEQTVQLENTNVATKHLLSIVNNILDISKIEAGEFKVDYNHFSLKNLIQELIALIENSIKEQNIEFEVLFDDKIESVLIGDKTHILQIMLNIISNAIKFTKDGKIILKCTCENNEEYKQSIKFEIIDNGIGMSKKYLKHFFQKFRQEEISKSKEFEGTGLGMYISAELINIMHGTISVDSIKNIGTTISFELPFKKGHESKIKSESFKDINTLSQSISILLVDDNEMNRIVAKNSLNMIKSDVVEADNGQVAIEILKKRKFDIILMDLQMPILDGIEATMIIRNELKLETPIIALTANALKSEIEHCFNIGMDDYIVKPFEEEDFLKKVISKVETSKSIKKVKNAIAKPILLEENTLYSLEKLKKMSSGNNEFVAKMISVFIELASESIILFEEYYLNNKIIDINRLAHKIKPSIQSLSINSIIDEIKIIEKASIIDENISNKILKINNVLYKVISELKNETLNS